MFHTATHGALMCHGPIDPAGGTTLHEILLEAGTNEVEFLEFYLGDQSFGINVAKVKQMVRFESEKITALPDQIPALLGSLHHLGHHIPILDLNLHLHREVTENDAPRIIILTDFNGSLSGYLVDGVNKIHRVNWSDFQPTSAAIQIHNPRITGMIILDNREIAILDFESILDDVLALPNFLAEPAEPQAGEAAPTPTTTTTAPVTPEAMAATALWRQPAQAAPTPTAPPPEVTAAPAVQAAPSQAGGPKLFIAEDSGLFRAGLINTLHHWHFRNLHVFENGLLLFRGLEEAVNRAKADGGDFKDVVDLVITDIEMPQMDGLTLCRNLKKRYPGLPVIILSSLITQQMALKCQSVEADANLSKKQLNRLQEMIATFTRR